MSLKKIAIRNKIKELLINKTDCDDHVYASRPTPLWEPELPAICVSIKSSGSEKIGSSSVSIFNKKLQIELYIVAKANNNVEDILDTIQAQVETVLYKNQWLTVNGSDLLKEGIEPVSDETDIVTESKIPVGCNLMKLTCSYDYEWPTTQDFGTLDEFITANTRFDINQDDTVDMDNTVTVRSES